MKLNKKKVHRLFHIWQGHQITDEEIYNAKAGKYPILTGHNKIKGYTDNHLIIDVPCITIPSKGIVNNLYLQKTPFDANNTIALIPKNRKEIHLEYIIYTQSEHITSFISSTNSNNYLNKEILRNIEIEYPDFQIQVKISDQYKKMQALKEAIQEKIMKLSKQISKNITTKGDDVVLSDVFVLKVGLDDEMTENYAYDNKGYIPIFSGASSNKGVFRYTDRIDYDYKEYITWSISGKAGTLYLRHGPCCLTRDCGIMIPKNKTEINLEWFILTQESTLRDFAIGRGGLGRLKKNLIELYPFKLSDRSIQDQITEEYKQIIELKGKLELLLQKIDKQIGKIVTHT